MQQVEELKERKMEGKEYEFLLSCVFGSSASSRGVDAEMFHLMLEEHHNIVTRSYYETHQERVIEFRKAFIIVREQVLSALIEGSKKIMMKVSDTDLSNIQSMTNKLSSDFFDIAELNHIIRTSIKLFSSYGLTSSVNNVFHSSTVNSSFRAFRN